MKYYLAYGPNLNLVQCAPGLPWFQERLLFDHGFSAALVPVYGGLRGL